MAVTLPPERPSDFDFSPTGRLALDHDVCIHMFLKYIPGDAGFPPPPVTLFIFSDRVLFKEGAS